MDYWPTSYGPAPKTTSDTRMRTSDLPIDTIGNYLFLVSECLVSGLHALHTAVKTVVKTTVNVDGKK